MKLTTPTISLNISFNEVDSAGIMYFANAFTLAHKAYESWVTQTGQGWSSWFQNSQWAFPIVDAHAQYQNPALGGQKLNLFFKIAETKNSSFVSNTIALLDDFQTQVFTVSMVHVCINPESQKKIPLPPEIKKALLP